MGRQGLPGLEACPGGTRAPLPKRAREARLQPHECRHLPHHASGWSANPAEAEVGAVGHRTEREGRSVREVHDQR